MRKFVLGISALVAAASVAVADVKSGLQVGERPPAFNVRDITGPSAGDTLCYRCRYGNSPVVTVFAREANGELATLAKELDEQISKTDGLKGFVVVLTEDADATTAKLKEIAKEKGIKKLPLTIIEGSKGPDNYKIAKDADVTVMMWVDSEVKVNHAYASKAFNAKQIKTVVSDIEKITK